MIDPTEYPPIRYHARRTITLKCRSCLKNFEATRGDAKTCSDACRMVQLRIRKKVEAELKSKKPKRK
jgi:hypothetical protein